MATLERLGIQGIRSFSPDHLEVISFEKPLTVIVGHNGAGKTTVVECLKFATTGELPPSVDRGRGWLYDPRLLDVAEVKGQVRLRVHAKGGKKQLTVVRSMQLTQSIDRKGRTKATFKQLEPFLQIKDCDSGQKASIGNKCADIDEQLPSLLGIHKAVLEHVVFCHQDDSCWPLAEMQILKKKFDQLFGATRYVKALENIRAVRKKHAAQAKDKQHDLELVETHMRQARLLQRQLEEAEALKAEEEEQIEVATETLKKKALELQQAEETEERLRELSSAIEVAKQLLARLEQDLRQQEEDQARQQGRDAQKQKNPRKDGEGPDEVEEEEEDDVTPEEEEEKEEDARFLQALEKESYEELVKLSEDIEKQFEAKRSRLRDLETRIEETQTEMTHLTEAIRTEQQKAVEGIRAEERKTACLKQKEEILRALSRACRQGAARSSSSSLGQKKKEEEENHGYFEGLSSGAIIETIDSRLDALRQESIDAATSTKAKLQNLHREEEVLQNRCSSLQSTLASREEVTNLLNLQLERAREQLQEKTKKKMNFNQALQDIEEELKKKEKEALEGSETKTEALETSLKEIDESLQVIRKRRHLLEEHQRLVEAQQEKQMKLQLAKQRMQELEKDIEEKEEKFLRSIHEQDWDSSPDAEDESSLTDFESGARWISVICKEKKDESTKISDQVRSLTSSLSSCKGQGESAGNSLRRLLPSLRENLLRASKYTPLTGKTSSSSSSSFSSHTKKHSLSSSSSSIWPIHLLHERKGENPPHRRDALPDDLSNPFFFKKHKTLSSSSSSLASRSQEYCFIPDEEILVQDSSLVLSVCTEGLRKRREKDIGEEINVLRREEVKVSELLTGQGGTGRGGAAGGSVCIQGWLLDMKEQSERDHACAFCKREFLLDEEILQMQKEVEMKVQAVPAQIQKLRLRQEEIRDALPQLQEEMHVIQSIEKQSEEVQKTLQVLQTLQQSYSQLKTSLKDAEIQAASASTAHMAALKLLEEAEDIRSLKIHNLQRYRQEVEDLEVDLHRALAYSKDKGPEEDDDEDGSFLPLLPKRRKAENPSKLVDLNEIKLKLQALEEEQTKSYARRDEVQRTLARAAEEKFEAQQATEGLRREREDLLRQKEEIARLQQEIEGYQKDIQRKQADLPEKQMELDRVKREVQNLQKHLREEESQAEVFKRETEEIARELETQRSRFLEISRQIREAERAVYEASQAASKRGEAILQDLREKRVHLTEELSLMKKSKDTQTHACKRGERLHTFLRNRISVYHKKEEIEREREKIRHLEDTLKEELKGKTFQKRRESDQKEDEKQTKKEEDEEEEEEQEEEEESVNDRVRRLRSECQRAKEKKARLEGSLQTRVERVKEIQKELKSSAVYRHVEEKYQSALVDAETELMAVKDLDRYHKALDKALMKYHSMKMKSVNATMKELWQTMYTGHDIDYIAIRSDTEEEAQKEISGNLSIFGKKAAGGEDEGGVSLGSSTGAVSAAGQRSYNYRVVLVKGEVELEMRGRCSAGQKVLASIIIRLALAETFCIHCGVLALDEPTTNLDRYNCESLARALAALVEARRGSESFQLILITHDEHFVMQLSRHGLCDKFFKIHKTLNGDSRISSCELQGF